MDACINKGTGQHQGVETRLGNGQLVRRRCTIENQFDLSRCII